MTQTRWFTFGADHRHPQTGESLRGKAVKIEVDADGLDACRARMIRYFGRHWSSERRELPADLAVIDMPVRFIPRWHMQEMGLWDYVQECDPGWEEEINTGAVTDRHTREAESETAHPA